MARTQGMKCYLIPRSNQPYICHWCEATLPTRSPYVLFTRYGNRLKMHVACSKQLVQRGWLYELDLHKLGGGRGYLDNTSPDVEWQEYILGDTVGALAT